MAGCPKHSYDRRGRHEARVFCAAGEAGSSRGVQTTPSCCLARDAGRTARSRLEQLLTVSPARRVARRYLETTDFERARAEMAKREVNERWQREMTGFFVQPEGVL